MHDRPDPDTRPPSSDAAETCPTSFDIMVCLVIAFLIPLGFLVAVGALLLRLRALRSAHGPYARSYWRCSALAHLLFAYAVLVLTLLAADGLLDHAWQLASRWPSLASRLGAAGDAQFLLLLDTAGALSGALVALAVARWFGHVDEANVWHPPRRLQGRAGEGCGLEAQPGDGAM